MVLKPDALVFQFLQLLLEFIFNVEVIILQFLLEISILVKEIIQLVHFEIKILLGNLKLSDFFLMSLNLIVKSQFFLFKD